MAGILALGVIKQKLKMNKEEMLKIINLIKPLDKTAS
jgi:hypothetical protein